MEACSAAHDVIFYVGKAQLRGCAASAQRSPTPQPFTPSASSRSRIGDSDLSCYCRMRETDGQKCPTLCANIGYRKPIGGWKRAQVSLAAIAPDYLDARFVRTDACHG